MMNQLVLLAGGKATRLRPVTETIPKSMLEVAGKPFIAHQLELVRKNAIEKVLVCASFLGEQIKIIWEMAVGSECQSNILLTVMNFLEQAVQ